MKISQETPHIDADTIRVARRSPDIRPARIVDLRHTQVPERPHIGATIERA
ncbi:MAG TPA: hypothetical protein VKK06_04420 [Terriglobia bacterium]|nr:hypothetical protein [Terriglobia bacterium]